MIDEKIKINRIYGYDILINNFEPLLRRFLVNEVLLLNFNLKWKERIPAGVFQDLRDNKDIQITENTSIEDFFEELNFLHLKDIIIFSTNYEECKKFLNGLNKEKFIEVMDSLNKLRCKIAHAKSSFSEFDLITLIEYIELLSQGSAAKEVQKYLKDESYKNAKEVPSSFFEDTEIQNNLPPEDYDLDGGFVGREKEIRSLMKQINSDQDRIITITGAGGVGKTAIALKVGYSYLIGSERIFDAIIWFSAKINKLTESGIISLDSGIKSHEQLIIDIMKIIDNSTLEKFQKSNVPFESIKTYLNNVFSSQKCLLIIDNLETIIMDESLTDFIKDIPRPSKVLITSRKGLGEIERRFPISDLPEKDAMRLFRLIAKERNRPDLLRIKDDEVIKLVKRVRCYPLLIKWSIGQVCLGKDVNNAFSEIFAGGSEIAKFSFNDVFSLLSDNSKTILYSMSIYEDKPISRYFLMHLSNLEDEQFEDAVKELILTSFIFPETIQTESGIETNYSMLTLTKGYVESMLDSDEKIRQMLMTRRYHLLEQMQELEKSRSTYSQTLFSLGIKTQEEQIAFNYVKVAKLAYQQNDIEEAEKNYQKAQKIAPRFSYPLIEFSKFEFYRNHYNKALELAKQAVDTNPDNYHAWFNLGRIYREVRKPNEAIECFTKAKELNPNYLPTYNELGRALSIIGQYEKADLEFQSALKEEKYPNYRHIGMTYMNKADNFKRWAEAFGSRRDFEGQMKMLEKAYAIIKIGLGVAKKDTKVIQVYRRICLDYGIVMCKDQGYSNGKKYLEESIAPFKIGKSTFLADNDTLTAGYFFLAAMNINDTDKNEKMIRDYIQKGQAICNPESKYNKKFENLLSQLPSVTAVTISKEQERFYGNIKFYDPMRKFGVVQMKTSTYIFFLSGFKNRLNQGEINDLDGRAVSFIFGKESKTKKGPTIQDIQFE